LLKILNFAVCVGNFAYVAADSGYFPFWILGGELRPMLLNLNSDCTHSGFWRLSGGLRPILADLDSGYSHSGFWRLLPLFWILAADSGLRILDGRFWILDSGVKGQFTSNRFSYTIGVLT